VPAPRRGHASANLQGAAHPSRPVGTIDRAPVLLSRRAQTKVYAGEGAKPGAALRALRLLRSHPRVRRAAVVLAANNPNAFVFELMRN
jgi:hypothetical protein